MIIEVNAEPTPLTERGIQDYLLQGRTGEMLPQILKEVIKGFPEKQQSFEGQGKTLNLKRAQSTERIRCAPGSFSGCKPFFSAEPIRNLSY